MSRLCYFSNHRLTEWSNDEGAGKSEEYRAVNAGYQSGADLFTPVRTFRQTFKF